MNEAHWRELQELLQATWVLRPEERGAYLDRHCDDPELRREVEALLAADEEAEGFFGRLARDAGIGRDEVAEQADLSGRRVGAYRLLEPLGRGGMGVVYLAERADGAFEQQVAVKLLAMGLAGAEGHRRFVAERQILAGLEHPDIARLLDGGLTEDGTPYFVMELVEGEPIDDWCDACRLRVDERVELLCRVCEAVEYAHRRLIVHRDLKPANVLVTDDGDPKLLDFGVAKLLFEVDPERTRTRGAAPLTPAWAAPEQLEGGPVTTATDTYALGTLGYLLLVGVPPHDLAERTPTAIVRQLQVEPPAPSRRFATLPEEDRSEIAAARGGSASELRRRLEGDLDAILVRALACEPERRYGSAGELAADLRRHLEGHPVDARAPSLRYRLGRFVARHRLAVASAAAIVALLAGLVVVSVVAAVTSRRQAERIAAERDRAQQVTVFLRGLFEANDPDVARGREITARELLDRGARQLRGGLEDAPELRAEMLVLLGGLYAELGDLDAARPLLTEGLRAAEESGELEGQVDALHALGTLDLQAGRYEEALVSLERAGQLLDEAGLVPGGKHGLVMDELLSTLEELGRFDEAIDRGEAALATARAEPDLSSASLFHYLYNLANMLLRGEQIDRAEALLREAVALEADPAEDPTMRIAVNSNLAGILERKGELEEALNRRRRAVALTEEIYEPLHFRRAQVLSNLGSTLSRLGRLDEAEVALRQALEIYEAVYAGAPHPRVAAAQNNLGMVLLRGESYEEAEPHIARARDLAGELFGHNDPRFAIATANLGRVLIPLARHVEAERLLREALEIRRSLLGAEHRTVGATLSLLAELRLAQGRPEEALQFADDALALYRRVGHEDPHALLEVSARRVRALVLLGRPEEAGAAFAKALVLGDAAGADAGSAWPGLLAAYAEFLVEQGAPEAPAAVARAVAEHRRLFGEAHPATQRMEALQRRVDESASPRSRPG